MDRFATWHAAEGVDPHVLDLRGTAAGYGEIWEDREQGEVELARLLVAPSLRGRGSGRALVGRLAEVAVTRGYAEVWLRVGRANLPAFACYARAGFQRASAGEEDRFNRGQPRAYTWMRWTGRG